MARRFWTYVLLTTLLAPLLVPPGAALAQPRPKPGETGGAAKASGEVTTFKRAGSEKVDPKDAKAMAEAEKKAEAAKVKKGPAMTRTRERTSAEDIDDELSILRELLEIERGSDTEADTLLELSYVLWDRAEAYELEAYDTHFEVGIAQAEAKGDKPRARILKVEQQNLLEQSRAAKLDVINHLKRIERNFPRFAKLDEVLYSLGFHLGELERPGEAVDAYMRLVRKAPKSSYLPDAYLGIGNYYFGKNQGGEALKWYNKVSEFQDSAVYGWGLYYIAWVNYNTQNWDGAVKGFVRVLDYSKNEARGRVTFVEDASKYLVRSWAETGKPKEALDFFARVAKGSEVMLLDNLALYYAESSSYDKSNTVIDELIEFAKEDAQMVKYLTLRLDNSYKLHDLDQTVHSAMMVGNALKQGSETGKKQRPQLELLLAEIGSAFHAESERTLDDGTLEAAEKIYRIYGEHFENGQHAYDMLHNHALALFQLADRSENAAAKAKSVRQGDEETRIKALAITRWRDSASAYERVITLQPAGKYAEPSAHRALIAYLRLQDVNQVTAEKGVDTADLQPRPLKPDEQRVAEAVDRYAGIALKNNTKEDVPEALFVAARIWYNNNHFDKAGQLFGTFITRFSDHALAIDAARLMLSAYNLGQDGKNLIVWTNKLIVDPRYTSGSPEALKLGETLTAIKSNEEYNKCLELKEQPEKAAQCLTKYATSFPESTQAPRALAGAARFYRDARKRDEVIATYRELARAYPQDPRAAQSLFEIGEIYRESASFDEAANAYEEFVRAYPDAKAKELKALVGTALSRAQAIRENLGQFDKVVEDGELFLAQPEAAASEKAVEVAYKLTVQYIDKGDWKGVIRASDKFLKRGMNIPDHLRLAAMVNTGTAQQKLGLGDRGKKLFDEVIKIAKGMSEAKALTALDQIGLDAIAQALFMTGELEFAKVQAIKGKPKDIKAAVELVTKKVKAAGEADKYYVEAESAKNPRWVAAASSRRGRIFHDIATSIKALPAPPAFANDAALQSEWAAQLAEKAKPHEETAISRYRDALKKAAEAFAFDSYFAEARDNLKALDTVFAETANVREFTVELTLYKWNDGQKPDAAIRELRMKLFDLSSKTGAAPIEGQTAETTTAKPANPEVAGAYMRLASAHHGLGQHRETLLVARIGMVVAAELKTSSVLWNLMGLSQHALGNTREALLAFKEAGRVDGKAAGPLLNAASITVRNLGFAETVELLDDVLARDPGNYWARVTRPVALRRMSDDPGKNREALAALDALANEGEKRPEGHYNRCVVAQATLTNEANTLPEMQQALVACEAALAAAGAKHARAGELQKRVQGIKDTISFKQ